MKRFIKITLLFTFLVPGLLKAQDTPSKTVSVLFVPQYVFVNTFRFDIDKAISKINGSITLSPYIYSGRTDHFADQRHTAPDNAKSNGKDYQYDKIKGFGLEGMYKFNVSSQEDQNVYFGLGMAYHNIQLSFTDYTWESYTQDGLEYYRYAKGNQSETIQRMDFIGMFGVKTKINNLFTYDLFVGAVYKNPKITSTLYQTREYSSAIVDYGYEGVVLRVGMSLGFMVF